MKTDSFNDKLHESVSEFYRDQWSGRRMSAVVEELGKSDCLERVELEPYLWFRQKEQIHTGFSFWAACSTSIVNKPSLYICGAAQAVSWNSALFGKKKDRLTLGAPEQFQVRGYPDGMKRSMEMSHAFSAPSALQISFYQVSALLFPDPFTSTYIFWRRKIGILF